MSTDYLTLQCSSKTLSAVPEAVAPHPRTALHKTVLPELHQGSGVQPAYGDTVSISDRDRLHSTDTGKSHSQSTNVMPTPDTVTKVGHNTLSAALHFPIRR